MTPEKKAGVSIDVLLVAAGCFLSNVMVSNIRAPIDRGLSANTIFIPGSEKDFQ